MINEHLVVLVNAARIVKQLLQVTDVLLDHCGDLLKLRKLVAIMVFEHAFGTDELTADLAEVLNLLVLMFEAENTRHVCKFRLG